MFFNYKIIIILFFLEQGVINMTLIFNKNVQCYKILYFENEIGFYNLWWIVLKRFCLFLGLVVLVLVILNYYQI